VRGLFRYCQADARFENALKEKRLLGGNGGCDRDRTSHKPLELLIAVLTDPVLAGVRTGQTRALFLTMRFTVRVVRITVPKPRTARCWRLSGRQAGLIVAADFNGLVISLR